MNPQSIYLNKDFSFEKGKLDENDLLIIQGYFSDLEEAQLLKFIKGGGKVVLFPELRNEEKDYAFQKWNKTESTSENNVFDIREWNRNEGVFANTANGRELALHYLKILKRKIPTQGETLAYYEDGKSFFRSKTIGQGIAYSFSTLPNREWSNLGEGFVLVPILIRIFSECTENPSLNLSECGDSTSLKQNGLVPVTGTPNHKPSVKAGIYKNLGKFLAFNRKATESQNEILNKESLQKTMPSNHIKWSNARTNSFSFERAEVWNFFLILMLFCLLAETLLGLPAANFSVRSKRL